MPHLQPTEPNPDASQVRKPRRQTGTAAKTEPQPLSLVRLEDRLTPNQGVPLPAGSLSGFVYEDDNNDGVKQAGEAGIPGVTVNLVRILGGITSAIGTTTTGADGSYRFTALDAGTGYQVREIQPPNYSDGKDTPGTTGGSAALNDVLSGVAVPAGGESFNNNFGELSGRLSGFVYEDDDDDGVKDAGEAGIPGTTVTLVRELNGATTTVGQTTTDAAGAYSFNLLLLEGSYRVVETQPAGYADGKDTPGPIGGGVVLVNDQIQSIGLIPDARVSPNNNFGERPLPPEPAQLSGFVYEDDDDDGIKDAGEAGIPNTTVTLIQVQNGVTTTIGQTATGADGSYAFTNLTPGTGYRVIETQPTGYADGKDTPGTTGGVVLVNDQIDAIPLAPGANSRNNNFGELPVIVEVGSLSGFVYEDDDNDGVKDAGEAGIGGTTVTLVQVANGVTTTVGTATTAADGSYSFTGLTPGEGYRVIETQPANYLDGKDTAGSTGGTVTNDQISGIPVPANGTSANNNFGELKPARLSGFVYRDFGSGTTANDDNGIRNTGETGIGGTTVTLTGTDDLGAVSRTATTAADGAYSFTGLRPGTYTVTETQPAGFIDGKDTIGTINGLPSTGTTTNDVHAGIALKASDNSPDNNFGELPQATPPGPGSLSGFVYKDSNDNGVKEAGEAPIAGVTVTLYRPSTTPGVVESVASTVTDANGAYSFTGLTPGRYWVQETQPANYVDGKDTPGPAGGVVQVNDWISAIPVTGGQNSPDNNFGERLLGSLSGFVYYDRTNDGVKQAFEAPIAGVTVTLYRPTTTSGVLESVASTVTDANGAYRFDNLTPGQYWVQEAQPSGYQDGQDTVGTTGGVLQVNDWISAINVPEGESANNNFGELVPGSLSGFVYRDFGGSGTTNNGVKEAGETGIAGVTLTLYRPTTTSGVLEVVATTTTDANGAYSFTGLAPGIYWVRESQPLEFLDGIDTPGPDGGIFQINDWLSAILVTAGRDSPSNNFGELPLGTDEQPPSQNPSTPVTPISKSNFLGSTRV